jgi:hypothetical protein
MPSLLGWDWGVLGAEGGEAGLPLSARDAEVPVPCLAHTSPICIDLGCFPAPIDQGFQKAENREDHDNHGDGPLTFTACLYHTRLSD